MRRPARGRRRERGGGALLAPLSSPSSALASPFSRRRAGGATPTRPTAACIAGRSATIPHPRSARASATSTAARSPSRSSTASSSFDQTLTITPALAEFWRASRDGLTWTFTLRKGVKFHHGREVTADDVVFSLTRLLDPRVKSAGRRPVQRRSRAPPEFRDGRAKRVSGLTALDRYTVQVVLDEAPAPFVSSLAVGHAKIVPRDLVERRAMRSASARSAPGPFRFVRWERGKEIVLAANREYFDGRARPRARRLPHLPGRALRTRCTRSSSAASLEDAPVARDDARTTGASSPTRATCT